MYVPVSSDIPIVTSSDNVAAPGPSPIDARPRIDTNLLAQMLLGLGQVDDLAELGRGGPLLASAGVDSLFHTLFGRDAIRMALDLLDDWPAVARATIVELARLQGVRRDPRAEEEPGRILHEDRTEDDPFRTRLEAHWTLPYYGAVDSTPQWVNLLVAYCLRPGREDEAAALLENTIVDRLGRHLPLVNSLLAALDWITGRLDDPRGGGYLWVQRARPDGIANQVWEDSSDSYYDADGTLLDPSRPYAPVAVQGYAYDALVGAADLLEQSWPGTEQSVACLRARAADLRAHVLRDFWQPDLDTFALALTFDDAGAARPARVIASSPGHLLASRLLDGDDAAPYRAQLIQRLFEPDLLAGAGIRTRALGSARFRAGSYHNGSTWPMDTGVIADGLRRHGQDALADNLDDRILAGCAAVGTFPEFFRGDPDGSLTVNTSILDEIVDGIILNRLEQPPQANQGWTVTRVWRILRRRGLVAPA
jgi:glycogen debranching enzyme